MTDEPMGSKDKFWIERPGDHLPWLFKYSRISAGETTGEHWSEKVACELAERLEVPHATVELASFENTWGSISRKFTDLNDDHVELVHGNEILAGCIPEYDRDRRFGQRQHTLENILYALQAVMRQEEESLRRAYLGIGGFVVLDALILNVDRHHENWGVFRNTSLDDGGVGHFLAPSFDHASSLARDVSVEKLRRWKQNGEEDWRAEWYARRGKGAVFIKDTEHKGANPLRLAELAARTWPEYVAPWLEHLASLDEEDVKSPLWKLPACSIEQEQREFAAKLISYTYNRLLELR
ncbi:HipA domain-containing protein [Halorhodospira halochloris]|uniref:HipA domain-containing protein n=1 Tax=Halorhodospira halochloris TaxID=1052 RepID=UPI001EE880A6|nr:HipA domain-containing protein [Halorhodospira halochloris]MCG5531219.1 HipA domain-containing protein [Halorhodospira halochloris]